MLLDFNGFVGFGEVAVWGNAAPVAKEGVPDGDVADPGVFSPDGGYASFEARGEAVGGRFKVFPTTLELGGGALIAIEGLPVVVDDEGRDVDVVGDKGVEASHDLFLGQGLAE